jgi:hypothetical protein
MRAELRHSIEHRTADLRLLAYAPKSEVGDGAQGEA